VLLPSGVEATSIHITGDLALLGSMPYGSGGSLLLFDVSDPLDIEQIGKMPLTVSDVVIQDNIAYVLSRTPGETLTTIDVSDMFAPVIMGTVSLPGTPEDSDYGRYRPLSILEDTVLIAQKKAGLQIVNAVDSKHLQLLGDYNEFLNAIDVAVVGETSYVLDKASGRLRIYDSSDPALPVEVGSYAVVGSQVAVQGTYAYVGGNDLRILDVSDPAHPAAVGIFPERIGSFDIAGDYIYATSPNFR
ncbi:MAG: hypothetical protein GY759_06930, partial [Chloroflexi bacterium]|nr:hypothetical protein [Chloroflexota bacterium]